MMAGMFLLIDSKTFNKDEIKINQIPKIMSVVIGSIIGFVLNPTELEDGITMYFFTRTVLCAY